MTPAEGRLEAKMVGNVGEPAKTRLFGEVVLNALLDTQEPNACV